METLIVKRRKYISILTFFGLIIIGKLAIQGWWANILMFLFVVMGGHFLLEIEAFSDLVIDETGIHHGKDEFRWNEITYISLYSNYARDCAMRLDGMDKMAIDPKELKILQSIASTKDDQGVFVGLENRDEISLHIFFKKSEYENIVSKLNQMKRWVNKNEKVCVSE